MWIGSGLEELLKGERVSIRVRGNPLPFAIGVSCVSYTTIATYGMKGRGTEVFHVFNDALFSSCSSSTSFSTSFSTSGSLLGRAECRRDEILAVEGFFDPTSTSFSTSISAVSSMDDISSASSELHVESKSDDAENEEEEEKEEKEELSERSKEEENENEEEVDEDVEVENEKEEEEEEEEEEVCSVPVSSSTLHPLSKKMQLKMAMKQKRREEQGRERGGKEGIGERDKDRSMEGEEEEEEREERDGKDMDNRVWRCSVVTLRFVVKDKQLPLLLSSLWSTMLKYIPHTTTLHFTSLHTTHNNFT